jgi:hypothetical protein
MARKIFPLCKFPYKPMDAQRHEIRLIQLRAEARGTNQSKSGCTLRSGIIHAERGHQPYTALSYAWGKNNNKAPLHIGDQEYYINETKAALQQIQDKKTDVFVWVDQICINQDDDVEKGHQVQQMKEILQRSRNRYCMAWTRSRWQRQASQTPRKDGNISMGRKPRTCDRATPESGGIGSNRYRISLSM